MKLACSVATSWVLMLSGAHAVGSERDVDWSTLEYMRHADYQAVDGDGLALFGFAEPIVMRGVWLNESSLMLDGAAAAPGFLGGLWQVYVQTVDAEDFGGTALWMGQYIGRILGNHPAGSYTDSWWLNELDRLGHDPISGHAFGPGDLVEIRARAPGMAFRGKSNVNEMHTNDPAADFDIYLLQAGYGVPNPHVVALAELKDATDEFIFDQTRSSGPERYQGTLVRINDVSFVTTNGWAADGVMEVTDGAGRTFPVKLSLGDGWQVYSPPPGTFDVVGIMDQEDLDGSDGFKSGYRVWISMDYDGNGEVIPCATPTGDSDYDNDVDEDDYLSFADCVSGPGMIPDPGLPLVAWDCIDAFDFDHDMDVDLADFRIFSTAWGNQW